MSELGGPTTQSGIHYQNSVAALFLGRLCDSSDRPKNQQLVEVRVEDLAHVDDIIVTYEDGHKVYVQAKENLSISGDVWTKLWKDFDAQFNEKPFVRGRDLLTLQIGFPQKEFIILREICDRASTSINTAEWYDRTTKDQKDFLKKLKPLLPFSGGRDVLFLELFKHLEISIYSLDQIERDYLPYWMPKCNRPPTELFRILRDRVGGQARRRGIFTAAGLTNSLKSESGIEFAKPPTIEQLNNAVRKCGAGLKQHKNTFGETEIHRRRPIVEEVVAWVHEGSAKNVAIILDQAGMGKTVVIRDILEELENQNISVLAFKADQLLGVESKKALQEKLELPDDVERTLDRLKSFGKPVLIIDQLDALSMSLAQDQATLDVLLDTIARVRLISEIKIVISCRAFDFNTDPRLANIDTGKKFQIGIFSDEELKAVLDDAGFSIENLSSATKSLLKTPLHLDLYLRSSEEVGKGGNLSSLQDLYSLLWRAVISRSVPKAPSIASREKVLEIITKEMDRKQQVSVPQSLITKTNDEQLISAAAWLASHGILISYKNEWNLIHQTFFDYCYAKNFVESGESLYRTVCDGEQGIFVRPQIIQVLSYLRGINLSTYIHELNSFLSQSDLRFHLRDHVLRWLMSLPDPSAEELSLVRGLLQNDEQKKRILALMSGNPGWFDLVKSLIVKDLQTQSDEALDTQTMSFLATFSDTRQAEVINVLRPYLYHSEAWNNRIYYVLSSIRVWSKEAIELFEDCFNALPYSRKADFWGWAEIAKIDEKVICRVLVKALDNVVDKMLQRLSESGSSYFYSIDNELEVLNSGTLFDLLDSIIENEFEYFLDRILPWVERILQLSGNNRQVGSFYFISDPLSHFWGGGVYVVHHQLIKGLIQALVKLSENSPGKFLEIVDRLSALPYDTPQRLVARVFSIVGDNYSNEAFSFLINDIRRFHLGDNDILDSRVLIKRIIPVLSDEQKTEIENSIYELPKNRPLRTKYDFTFVFRDQLLLFRLLPEETLSARVRSRLNELERRFPDYKPSETESVVKSGFVGAPLSIDTIRKMSDKAWLSAMRKYEKGVQHKDFLKGGARELAGSLAEQIKEDPNRFYNLAMRTSADLDVAYVNAFVNGLANSEIESDKLFEVIRHFKLRRDPEFIRSFTWALEKKAQDRFPDDVLQMLRESLNSPIGDDETWWQQQEKEQSNQRYFEGVNQGPYSSYLNSSRGVTFRTIMRVLDARGDLGSIEQKWQLIQIAVDDDSLALKAGAIEELIYMLNSDKARAIDLFEQLVVPTPFLLNVRYSLDFLYYSFPFNYERLKPLVVQAMDEKYESTRRRGAELACLVGLYPDVTSESKLFEDATEWASKIIDGPVEWRRGAAAIYTANISKPDLTDICLSNLTKLIDDPDNQVQQIVGDSFKEFSESVFQKATLFFDRYAESNVLRESDNSFTTCLWEYGTVMPERSLEIIEKYLQKTIKLPAAAVYLSGENLIRLVLRIYTDVNLPKPVREKALDNFDTLMLAFPGPAVSVLQEFDRR